MADFYKALKKLHGLEFKNRYDALHKNSGEDGLTFFGIYQCANPKTPLWGIVEDKLLECKFDIKKASSELYDDTKAKSIVEIITKKNYWDKAQLDKIESQKIAEEIFIFGFNAGMRTAIRKAQKLVGAKADGIIGFNSLKALNNFDETIFDYKFDDVEKIYYADLIANNPSFKIFEDGWNFRAEFI